MQRLNRLPKEMLLVISDSKRALLLRNEGTEIHPSLAVVERIESAGTVVEPDGSDRSGRRFGGSNGVVPFGFQSAMKQSDTQRLQSMEFADQLTDELTKLFRQDRFKNVVLAAPPAFLGALRDAMPPEVARCVAAEIPKHLTEATIEDIQSVLFAPW